MNSTTVQLELRLANGSGEGWRVLGMHLSERLGEPFELRLRLANDLGAEPSELLGTSMMVTISRAELERQIGGITMRVEDGAINGDELHATVTIAPALVALRHRHSSRIFGEMSVAEILTDVLGPVLSAYGQDLDISVSDRRVREHTVQFRETDFDFVHRLIEEQGFIYRFVNLDGVETMTIRDDGGCDYEPLRSVGNEDGTVELRLEAGDAGFTEELRSFERSSSLRPTIAETLVYSWLEPESLLHFEDDSALELPTSQAASVELTDYRHETPTDRLGYRSGPPLAADIEADVALRRAVHQRDAVVCVGNGTMSQVRPGSLFELSQHPQPELVGEYLVVGVEHFYGSFATGATDQGYHNRIECVPSSVEWRPARVRPQPRISGVHTATVVGPPGEEVHTDAHGRVKVQFHWDRRQRYDEGSSCFVRVVQPWAGNGWGSLFLPRVGMEVTVVFVDGDPDRPIVTGSLYNGANPPPYALPDERTKSTIKSSTSPGGGGFNELRFEDAAGCEEIYLHAQCNLNEVVLANHCTSVGNDHTRRIHRNQSLTVDGWRGVFVGGDHTEKIKGDEKRCVEGNIEEDVLGGVTRHIVGKVEGIVDGGHCWTTNGDRSETVNGKWKHTVNGDVSEALTGCVTREVSGSLTDITTGAVEIEMRSGLTQTVTGKYALTATAGFTVTAPGGITVIDTSASCEITPTKSATIGKNTELGLEKESWWDRHSEGQTVYFYANGASVGVNGFTYDVTGYAYTATAIYLDNPGHELSKGLTRMFWSALFSVG
jgi:type VI secretion system secreted protein VgrG